VGLLVGCKEKGWGLYVFVLVGILSIELEKGLVDFF